MGAARLSEGLVMDRKRHRLGRFIRDRGHQRQTSRGPVSALDCVLLLLGVLDSRDDPYGRWTA